MLVLPGAGAPHAQFDPSAWRYNPVVADGYNGGLAAITAAAFEDGFTLIDLRPLRPLVTASRARNLDQELVRVVHGFDAALVMSGSTASANL